MKTLKNLITLIFVLYFSSNIKAESNYYFNCLNETQYHTFKAGKDLLVYGHIDYYYSYNGTDFKFLYSVNLLRTYNIYSHKIYFNDLYKNYGLGIIGTHIKAKYYNGKNHDDNFKNETIYFIIYGFSSNPGNIYIDYCDTILNTCQLKGDNGDSYHHKWDWEFSTNGNNFISLNIDSQNISINTKNKYYYRRLNYSNFGCKSYSNIIIDTLMYLNNITYNINENIFIYPNPVTNQLFITYNINNKIYYSIITINGLIIKRGIYKNSIDVSMLNKGTYILKLTTVNKTKSLIFIK